MSYILNGISQPMSYGGGPPPGNHLSTLEGKLLPLIRIEKIEDTSPQRYKAYTAYRYLDEINTYSLFKFRLRLQIKIDNTIFLSNHERDSVKLLSCSDYSSNNEDEDVCIELEHQGRKNNRLTKEEMSYIRELDGIKKSGEEQMPITSRFDILDI